MKPTTALDIALAALLRILREAPGEMTPKAIAAQAVRRIERLGDEWTDGPSARASEEPDLGASPAGD